VRAYAAVREVVEGQPCQLLEAVAERIAGRLLSLRRVQRATVTVRKRPPLEGEFRAFGVEVTRPL
jgi:dihydroneopterin aldolase